MNITMTSTAEINADQNPLYVRMRSRFDFSGNRTIGEFMMMKATREGYNPPAKAAPARRSASTSRRPLISLAALLLSCMMLIVGAISFVSAIVPEDYAETDLQSGIVHISLHNDPETLGTIFPTDYTDATIQE